jgi:hypothetical protein
MLAIEHCHNEAMIANHAKLIKLETDFGDKRAAKAAQDDSRACAEKNRKIETALKSSGKVKSAIFKYMDGGCSGPVPQ